MIQARKSNSAGNFSMIWRKTKRFLLLAPPESFAPQYRRLRFQVSQVYRNWIRKLSSRCESVGINDRLMRHPFRKLIFLRKLNINPIHTHLTHLTTALSIHFPIPLTENIIIFYFGRPVHICSKKKKTSSSSAITYRNINQLNLYP